MPSYFNHNVDYRHAVMYNCTITLSGQPCLRFISKPARKKSNPPISDHIWRVFDNTWSGNSLTDHAFLGWPWEWSCYDHLQIDSHWCIILHDHVIKSQWSLDQALLYWSCLMYHWSCMIFLVLLLCACAMGIHTDMYFWRGRDITGR